MQAWDSKMVNIFHCYEFLLLNTLDNDSEYWHLIKSSILKENGYSLKSVPNELWFVVVTINETKERFPSFLKKILLQNPSYTPSYADCILTRYLQHHDFVEMHLDSVFKHGDTCSLPKELFRCPNLRVLSLKYNFLRQLPADVGKLQRLEYLALTNNKLQNPHLPYTLGFCARLRELFLDNNLLDALPGFLLRLPSLRSVHRHGNHNYFKATFMWYHTDVNERTLAVPGKSESACDEPRSLKLLSAAAVIAAKVNFFSENAGLPPSLVDFICNIYFDFNVCHKCPTANLKSKQGYKVYTFKNPYLGNTCVPFLHWACSPGCAEAIEVPAREEQLLSSMEQDRQYNQHVQEAQDSILYSHKGLVDSCLIL